MQKSLFLMLVLLARVPTFAADNVERLNSVERVIRVECRVVNPTESPQDATIYLALPRTNERQEVLGLYPERGSKEIIEDAFGNKIAVYDEKGLEPGEVRSRGWMAGVRLHAAVYGPLDHKAMLPAAERDLYTRDSSSYQIGSPSIARIRDSVVKPSMTDTEKALALFNYLIRNVTYVRDEKWDPAPAVLEKKQGSCSEYNYALIALLRSCGIPCRYTGGFILTSDNRTKYDPRVHEDSIFHRWTEIFLEDHGWFPADASRGSSALKKFDNVLNLWGRLPAGSLQTFRGDGGKQYPLEWSYFGRVQGPKEDALRSTTVAYWVDARPEALEPAIQRATAATSGPVTAASLASFLEDPLQREALFFVLRGIDGASCPILAGELLKVRHPSAIYYSLYSGHLGGRNPDSTPLSSMADAYLASAISKALGAPKSNWGAFEYWWRKARAEISWSEEAKAFLLQNKNFNIH